MTQDWSTQMWHDMGWHGWEFPTFSWRGVVVAGVLIIAVVAVIAG